MQIVLKIDKPSAHWIGLANIVGQSDGLRSDITLMVDEEGARFVDDFGEDIFAGDAASPLQSHRLDTLAGKLKFLEWLHQTFPKPRPVRAARMRAKRLFLFAHSDRDSICRPIRFDDASTHKVSGN